MNLDPDENNIYWGPLPAYLADKIKDTHRWVAAEKHLSHGRWEPFNSPGFADVYTPLTPTDDLPKFDSRRKFENDVHNVFLDSQTLLMQKHADYGPKNISGSPGGALNGIRVRMHDKLARINHLLDSGNEPENESLEDSFVDLLNYSAIALLVMKGQWPE